MPKVAVCYAWSSEFMYTGFTENTLNMEHPDGWDVRFFRGTGWCPARRHNDFCEKALKWGADYICSIGSDQVHPENMLIRLVKRLEEGCQVISALVPMRGYVNWQGSMKPFQPLGWKFSFEGSRVFRGMQLDHDMLKMIDPADGDLQQVHVIGSGVIMFHKDLLLTLKKPWFFETPHLETQERVADQDSRFVWRLQAEAGAKIWVDTTIKVKHLHVFPIDDTFSERFADWADPSKADLSICKFSEIDNVENLSKLTED